MVSCEKIKNNIQEFGMAQVAYASEVLQMRMPFGRHEGKSIEIMVIKFPDYLQWAAGPRGPQEALAAELAEARRLVELLDQKEFTVRCFGKSCLSRATRLAIQHGCSSSAMPLCNSCRVPASAQVQIVRTCGEVFSHVRTTCNGTREEYRRIIRVLAMAKGLPSRVTEKIAIEFFKS
jgi:hypothetical protein